MATIKYKDKDGEWKELAVLKGDSGVAPIINPDTNTWLVWDNEQGIYVDTGVVAGVGTEDFYASTYWVFNEMASGKKVIAKALTDRRYPTNNDESFVDMAQKITDMNYEEGWFAKIGYTKDNDGGIQDAIDYAYELAKAWNPDGSTAQIFRGNKILKFLPQLDTSNVRNMNYMFGSCSALTTIPQLDTSNATYMGDMFNGCSALTTVPQLDTSNVRNMNYMFGSCSALTTILQLDISSVINMVSTFNNCSALIYMMITNLGKSSLATYDFGGATNWGTLSEENRQSLIDSLITYSYDRASNGMATATISLSANTKALLTEEEIAQITAKGFTIA